MANAKGVKRERSFESISDVACGSDRSSSASPSLKRGKFERSFVASWLERFDWLVYNHDRNLMFCDLCRKYRKNNAFTDGCHNFRRDNLNKHVATNDHKYCVEQEAHCKSGVVTVVSVAEARQLLEANGSPTSNTPGRHSSTDSTRSSGIFSLPSNSLPQSPVSMSLPSPPSLAPSRSPSSSLHAPVPLLPVPPLFQPYLDRRIAYHGDPNGEVKLKESLPIMPNYMAHPPFPYLSGSSSYRPVEAIPVTGQRHSQEPVTNTPPSNEPDVDANELVLKVRVADSVDEDFIEIEVDKGHLTFDVVLATICRELNVNPSLVQKLRKLPNTAVRKDKDVKRFMDFQELEVVLANRGNGDSRNYGPVSPRHVDVVY